MANMLVRSGLNPGIAQGQYQGLGLIWWTLNYNIKDYKDEEQTL